MENIYGKYSKIIHPLTGKMEKTGKGLPEKWRQETRKITEGFSADQGLSQALDFNLS